MDKLLLSVLLASVAVIAAAVVGGTVLFAVLPPTSAGVVPADAPAQADAVSLIATVAVGLLVAVGSLLYLRKTMSAGAA